MDRPQLLKKDFEAVLIGEGGWGPIDKELAESHDGLFHCGHCSIERHKVFHNRAGQHLHIPADELTKRIDAITPTVF